MTKDYQPIMHCNYGPLNPKVNLLPDFFTGFEPARRKGIVEEEAKFYRGITAAYAVNFRIEKKHMSFQAEDGAEIRVKLYRPQNCSEQLPAVMFFHGGGFMTCSVETHDFVPSYLAANASVAVFSVEYRLAPEYKFPKGLEDCYAACQWVAGHSADLGVDSERIAVCGDSSGGNFAAAIALMAKERKNLKLWKQVLIYPVTELSGQVERTSPKVYTPVGGSSDGPSPMLVAYLNDPVKDVKNPLVSPLLAEDLTGLPEALFIEAECDALLDDGLYYAKALQDAGVSVQCSIYQGMPHAFVLRTYEETFEALNRICAFLKI